MELKKFNYLEDRNLVELKKICKKSGSKALNKTFEYLRVLFYFNRDKVVSEFIPDVAYYVAQVGKDKIRLVDLGVSLEQQRKGIGSLLIKRVVDLAKSKGLKKITLRTSSEETAFMFYQKLGFKDVGLNKNDIEMELRI